MEIDLGNKTAFITGGSKVIGKAIPLLTNIKEML